MLQCRKLSLRCSILAATSFPFYNINTFIIAERKESFAVTMDYQTAGLPTGAVVNCADNSGESLVFFP